MTKRKRNPMVERRALTGSAYSRIDPTDDMLQAMWEDADAVGDEAQAWLARWHPLGQSQWLGGQLGKGSRTWHPGARVKEAFRKMSEASRIAKSAGHELAMFMVDRANGRADVGRAIEDAAPPRARRKK